MAIKTKQHRAGKVLIGLIAAGGVLCVAACVLNPLLKERFPALVETTISTVKIAVPEKELEQEDVPADTPAATSAPAPTPEREKTAFQGWDAAALDEFCARQPSGFSVYAQDLQTGEVYTYNEEIEYYPASTLKAAYALWLCEQAEQGILDLEGDVNNLFPTGRLDGGKLDAYDGCATIPAWDVMYAMISVSDNDAVDMLSSTWPANEDTGFCDFLNKLGFHAPYSCSVTREEGIQGIMNVQDAGLLMQALYEYFGTETGTALQLMDCFLGAEHTALYIPEGAEAAKKYGSWDYAFHDFAIVYAERPYILCCMTDQGSQTVDFPPEAVAAMQELGRLVYEQETA